MDLQIEAITRSLSSLAIDETKIIKIQKWFRGCILRLKQLPLIMYKIKKYLKLQAFQFSTQNEDNTYVCIVYTQLKFEIIIIPSQLTFFTS